MNSRGIIPHESRVTHSLNQPIRQSRQTGRSSDWQSVTRFSYMVWCKYTRAPRSIKSEARKARRHEVTSRWVTRHGPALSSLQSLTTTTAMRTYGLLYGRTFLVEPVDRPGTFFTFRFLSALSKRDEYRVIV